VSRASNRPIRFHPCGCIIVLNADQAKDKRENIAFETEIRCYSLSVTLILNACGFPFLLRQNSTIGVSVPDRQKAAPDCTVRCYSPANIIIIIIIIGITINIRYCPAV
jgi:hypothetical protein